MRTHWASVLNIWGQIIVAISLGRGSRGLLGKGGELKPPQLRNDMLPSMTIVPMSAET